MPSAKGQALIREIKSNQYIEEQKLIASFVSVRLERATEELINTDDDRRVAFLQGAIKELKELKRILGDY